MAQRYGGKYSPSGDTSGAKDMHAAPPLAGTAPGRAGARVNLLFIAPLPLVFSIFGGGATALAVNLVALGVLLLAAWLTREGQLAHEAFDARKIAKAPAVPRKLLGSALTGAGLALASFLTSGVFGAAVIGIAGAVLHSFAFGIDPMKSKGAEGIDPFQQDRVARVVDEAETHLTALTEAVGRVGDRHLVARADSFASTARRMFRTVEEDPRDLSGARKYLGVYLKGARDAAVKFADLHARRPDPADKASFEALLDDLEKNFTAKTEVLLSDNRSDMDVEIKVLRDRLQREGLSAD